MCTIRYVKGFIKISTAFVIILGNPNVQIDNILYGCDHNAPNMSVRFLKSAYLHQIYSYLWTQILWHKTIGHTLLHCDILVSC